MVTKNRRGNVLYVTMFGSFTLTWNETLLMSEKEGQGQFTALMQMLLHHPEQGVSREDLEQTLFGDREIGNVRQALQSLLAQARETFLDWDLPAVEHIRQRDGRLFWTREIPVVEDAAEFDRCYQDAIRENKPERRTDLLLEACYCYSGEFLADQSDTVWAVTEAQRYRAQFCECMVQAAEQLRSRKDYVRMEELGLYAAETDPLTNWETLTMEALIDQGRYEEAQKLYERTVERYALEGLQPSGQLTQLMQCMGDRYVRMERIQSDLEEANETPRGGYLCTYPVCRGVYQMLKRMMERSGQSIYMMLCTAVNTDGDLITDPEELELLSQRLCDSILNSVRKGDVLTRYAPGQYLVLLINTTRENCSIVQKRIDYRFSDALHRFGIHYFVSRVISPPETGRGGSPG